MKKFLSILLFLGASSSLAGQTGFLYQGKEYVVYKDGVKVGQTFEELFPKTKRNPAATQVSGYLMYEEDEIARCYMSKKIGRYDDVAQFCVKK